MSFLQTDAQISFPFTKSVKHAAAIEPAYSSEGWRAGINILSFAEPQSAVALTAEYRFERKFSVWTEVGYIFKDAYIAKDWSALSGFRFIIQPRYFFTASKQFFIAPELRIKNFKYNTTGTFINAATTDTLKNIPTRVSHHTIGGAIVIGMQTRLGDHLLLEYMAGIGVRQRNVYYNAPENYSIEFIKSGFGLSPNYGQSMGLPYFPIGIRLTWCFI